MNLCVLIPAKDEEAVIATTLKAYNLALQGTCDYQILVVNDHSKDNPLEVLEELKTNMPNLSFINNQGSKGVGGAIKYGLKNSSKDVVAICMADGSDDIYDVINGFQLIRDYNYDCVFGSRFIKGSRVIDYPIFKLLLNRLFNNYVRLRSAYSFNDFTNIFKIYHRSALLQIEPVESNGFSIGLEMSLKAYKNDLNICVVPISWTQRKAGKSKLNLWKNLRVYLKTLKHSLEK